MSGLTDEYMHYYQSLLFRYDEVDSFGKCSIRRKCLGHTFKASVKDSNETTCCILDKKLQEYANLIDNQDEDDINNYAKPIEALTAHTRIESFQWKSQLKDPQLLLNKMLASLECSGKLECQADRVTESDIATLRTVFKKKSGNMSGAWMPGQQGPSRVGYTHSSEDNKMVQSTASMVIPTFRQQQDFYFNPTVPQSNNPLDLFREQREKCHNNQHQSSKFHSASDELHIQNLKKWGTGRGGSVAAMQQQPSYGYGAQKRSLGARRGVMNKFVPPVRSDEGGMVEQRQRSDYNQGMVEEDDERLRNIEPKMIELIRNEIMDCGAPVTWDDIAGLEFAKSTIQEIVVWPMLRPDIFTGLRRPPKGILLFGPPGTGKTLIGKCIASQSRSTFFSISASSLTSKWIGEGEKMVRALFAVARCHQPSVVFIDEIDSLLSQRSETEHESSRRIKTEFLVQLDGAATGEEDRILIIGATNRPQELDEAARRRLVKRLYIPLPNFEARRQIVERLMSNENHCLSAAETSEISNMTDGYSGADMKNVCQEASLGPIRSMSFLHIENITPDQVRPITVEDFKTALRRVRASVSQEDLVHYISWDKQYGSGGPA